MRNKENFRQIFRRSIFILDKITSWVTVFVIIVTFWLMSYFAMGRLLNEDFLKYFITISFVMAGFTFNAFFQKEESEFKNVALVSCYLFIMDSFFLLTFLIVPREIFGGVVSYVLGFVGTLLFFFGFMVLVLGVYFEVNPPRKKIKKKQ